MARVVHVGEDRFDVYVGRRDPQFPAGSRWGNPFRIGDPHPITGVAIGGTNSTDGTAT